jgi:hypothetical protein
MNLRLNARTRLPVAVVLAFAAAAAPTYAVASEIVRAPTDKPSVGELRVGLPPAAASVPTPALLRIDRRSFRLQQAGAASIVRSEQLPEILRRR